MLVIKDFLFMIDRTKKTIFFPFLLRQRTDIAVDRMYHSLLKITRLKFYSSNIDFKTKMIK